MAITYVNASTVEYPSGSESATFTLSLSPAGFVVGDVLVLVPTTSSGSTTSITPPEDAVTVFGPASGVSGVNGGVYLYAIPGPTKPSSVTFTWPSAQRGTLAWVQLRGANVSSPLDASGIGAWSSNFVTSWSAPAFDTVSAGAFLVSGVICGSGSGSPTLPSGSWTRRTDATQREGTIATKGVVASPSTQAAITYSGSEVYGRAWQIAIRDAAVVAPPTQSRMIVGIPTDTGVQASVKVSDADTVRLKAGTDAAVTAGVVWGAVEDVDADGWAKIAATSLAPDTDYWVRAEYEGSETVLGPVYGPLRTAPTPGTPTSFAFYFGGDIEPDSDDGTAWTNMQVRRDGARFWLGTGDQHPYDNTSSSQASHRADWENALALFPSLRQITETLPVAITFSDHDAGGGNNSVPGVWTAPNIAAYSQVWPYPTSPLLPDNTAWSFVWGRVRFIGLDTYHQRTSTYKLSPAQVSWLEGELAQPEPLKVIVESGTWPDFEPPEGWPNGDGWTEYPTQVAALTGLFEGAVGKVFMIHGDAHTLSADDGSNNPWGGFPTADGAPIAAASSQKGDNTYSQGYWPAAEGVDVHQHGYVQISDDGEHVTVAFTGFDTGNVPRVALSFGTDGWDAPVPVTGTSTASLTGPATNRWLGKVTRPLWRDGSGVWRAILPTASGHRFYTLDPVSGAVQGAVVDNRQGARVDVVHHEGTTYVLRAHSSSTLCSVYNAALGTVVSGASVPLTSANLDSGPITLHRSANGYLWAANATGGVVRVSRSVDNGASWTTATTIYTMAATTGIVKLVSVGTNVLALIFQNDGAGPRLALRIAENASSLSAGNWTTEALPAAAGVTSDDHLSACVDGSTVYVATKVTDPATSSVPLIELLTRSPAGEWTAEPVEWGPEITGLSFTRPTVTVMPDGEVLLAMGSNTIYPPHLYARTRRDGLWSDRFVLIPGGATGYDDSGVLPYPQHINPSGDLMPILARDAATSTITTTWYEYVAPDTGSPPLYIGGEQVTGLYLGATPVEAIYLGDLQLA